MSISKKLACNLMVLPEVPKSGLGGGLKAYPWMGGGGAGGASTGRAKRTRVTQGAAAFPELVRCRHRAARPSQLPQTRCHTPSPTVGLTRAPCHGSPGAPLPTPTPPPGASDSCARATVRAISPVPGTTTHALPRRPTAHFHKGGASMSSHLLTSNAPQWLTAHVCVCTSLPCLCM